MRTVCNQKAGTVVVGPALVGLAVVIDIDDGSHVFTGVDDIFSHQHVIKKEILFAVDDAFTQMGNSPPDAHFFGND